MSRNPYAYRWAVDTTADPDVWAVTITHAGRSLRHNVYLGGDHPLPVSVAREVLSVHYDTYGVSFVNNPDSPANGRLLGSGVLVGSVTP